MTTVARKRPLALLFDVDGVLIDSGAAHARVWAGWARARGLDPALVQRATQGRRRIDTLRRLAPDRPPVEENRLLDALMAAEEPTIAAYEGVRELLCSLAPGTWALVTSSRAGTTASRMTALGLPLPEARVCAEDVRDGKPSPEGYLAAAAALGVAPSDCLVLEDSPAGIRAGRAAGCVVHAVSTTHPPHRLRAAHACFSSLRDAVASAHAHACDVRSAH
ncbi:HAD-IA family hydrolase [Streptomyces daliensis]|uniref:HAD-IA family hydrolase n=1 Tax=Streptomyces daliensis TaxID=299421 RepID=A0A8T4IV19_9ACTN|nr:HAD-IA family hydrolase [Streptomyces daliensis]